MNLFLCTVLFVLTHTLVWASTNLQFIPDIDKTKTLWACVLLAIPTSVSAWFASKACYEALDSAWAVRLFAFGVSYLVFPLLTWIFLKESPFTLKTMLCIGLSFSIILIQVFLPNT